MANQIGTQGISTAGGGTAHVPIWDPADVQSGHDMVRTGTASGAGCIFMANPAPATYDHIRVGTQNYGTLAVHDKILIDDYEDGDLLEYGRVDAPWSASTTWSYTGSYGAYADGVNNGSGWLISTSGDGLGRYPTSGDVFEFWWKYDTIEYFIFAYGGSNGGTNSHYEVEHRGANNDVLFQLDDAGSETNLGSDSVTWAADNLYRTVIHFNPSGGDSHQVEVYDEVAGSRVVNITATDATFKGSDIRFYANGSVQYAIDDFAVTA